MLALSLRICFSQFFQDTYYTKNTHLGTCLPELVVDTSCQEKNRRKEAVCFYFDNRLNVTQNLNVKCTLKYIFS